MNTKLLWWIGAIIIAVGAWYFLANGTGGKMEDAGGSQDKAAYTWQFENLGENPDTHGDMTKVTLTSGGKTYDAGTYQGSCAEIGAQGGVDGTGLVAGEVSGAQCWFAGGGDEIGVFSENGKLVIKRGQLEEPQGEGGAFRGNFTTLLSL